MSLFARSCNNYSLKCWIFVLTFLVMATIIVQKAFVFEDEGNSAEWRAETRTNGDAFTATNIVPPNCQPATRILFLKTHKTGSSTITNILNRYGKKQGLTFALPAYDYSFQWPTRFRTSSIIQMNEKPNILCNHARYSRGPMNFLFPKQQSKYVTILRHPVTQYESIFMFFKLASVLPFKGNSSLEVLESFLARARPFDEKSLKGQSTARLLRDPMLFDLGLDYRYFQNLTATRNYIEFLHKEFDLVLIMEYFDESMVLLKRNLCLTLNDVLYLKLNERRDKDKVAITEKIKRNIVSWNRADMMLYESFNKTFWARIKSEGDEFYRDLEKFRKKKKEAFEKCIKSNRDEDEAYTAHYVKGYVLNTLKGKDNEFCSDLVRNELDYIALHKQRYKKRMKEINSPGQFDSLFDKRNNWDVSQDLKHRPV